MKTSRKYVVAVTLLAVLAVAFGVLGTVAPTLAQETTPAQPLQESSPDSVRHFMNPPTYDSGWVNITTKAGQYVSLKHNLNTTNVVVDITGKQSLAPKGGAPAWNKTYGGTSVDTAQSVVQTADGGYTLAGWTWSYGAGNYDFYLVKTDSAGTMLWNRTYGGTSDDRAYSMVQTGDGGYALAGWTYSYGAGGSDIWLVKTDSAGTLLWNRTYGGIKSDNAWSVVQAVDGGYALAGYTNSYGVGTPTYKNFWLVRTDSSGTAQWNKTYGGTRDDAAYSVVQTGDEGYALAGSTLPFGVGFNEFWLIKTDSSGTMLWNRTYGGTMMDEAHSVVLTNDGGYALTGNTYSSASLWDFLLVKTDSSGTAQWNKKYGGTSDDYPISVVQTGDGGYALAGYTMSSGAGSWDYWLVRTDVAGTMLWNRTYGGTSDDRAYSMIQTSDGGYALAGRAMSFGDDDGDVWLVKVKPDMNLEHKRNLGIETGLARTGLTNTTITLYRGTTDAYWNYVRVRIWLVKEPTWMHGDINMDGTVNEDDLYILARNYGKTFSLLTLSGIIAIAGIHKIKKRKQNKQPNFVS